MSGLVICEADKCTGCCACLNVCPTDCISLVENDLGEIHPHVASDQCVKCNKCIKACPANGDLVFVSPKKVLANWSTDVAKRRICASGGIATTMSEYVIQSGGVVYGTRYDTDLTPICCRVDSLVELEALKGSKYVQSYVGYTYRQAQSDLDEGKLVLFIGTPCQVAGLIQFLARKYENLIACDLICHGVSPASYFQEEMTHLKQCYGLSNITDCRFRGNDGRNFWLTLWDNEQLLYKRRAYSQYYFSAFLKGISLRESCYSCPYAQEKRISDITIGDFIGLGKNEPFIHSTRNVSVTTLNSEASLAFWEKVEKGVGDLVCEERSYSEAVEGGPSLRAPFPRHELTEGFRELYLEFGWVKAIRTVLKKDVAMDLISYWLVYIRRIPGKVIRKILQERP